MKKRLFHFYRLFAFAAALTLIFCACGKDALEPESTKSSLNAHYSVSDYAESSSGIRGALSADMEYKQVQNELDVIDVAQSERKIIRSASLEVQSEDFDNSITTLKKNIEYFGGYVESSSIYSNSGPQYASFSVRIPSKSLDNFLAGAHDCGTVIHSSTSDREVTEQYYDTETRIKTLKVQQERLLAILNKAESL